MEVLRRFTMEQCKPSKLLLNQGTFLVDGDDNDSLANNILYRAAVGALLYLSRVSGPDLAFAVNQVAAYANKPKITYWQSNKSYNTLRDQRP